MCCLLPQKDLASCYRVCRSWRGILSSHDERLWKGFCGEEILPKVFTTWKALFINRQAPILEKYRRFQEPKHRIDSLDAIIPPRDGEEPYHHLLKIALIGDHYAGKSDLVSIIRRDPQDSSRITGVDLRIKSIGYRGKHIKLQLWSIAGDPRYRTITPAYYRGASAVLYLFDCCNEVSGSQLENST
eukprot:TRINITY_DN2436_c0_g3_i2.p1 TRINITY_DN2436_c0_g3~~TRINITY_DN2436_c0_g3_i2.p1  ORF type:complete len:186 (-),score=23.21 TRINITY_DN2436_c0_g3_i2:385-942(-)